MSSPGSNSYVGLSGGLVQASILHNLTILGSLSIWTTLCLSVVSGWGTLSGTGRESIRGLWVQEVELLSEALAGAQEARGSGECRQVCRSS